MTPEVVDASSRVEITPNKAQTTARLALNDDAADVVDGGAWDEADI
jgi:hypothetical protein